MKISMLPVLVIALLALSGCEEDKTQDPPAGTVVRAPAASADRCCTRRPDLAPTTDTETRQ
jgi:hypothetical protein